MDRLLKKFTVRTSDVLTKRKSAFASSNGSANIKKRLPISGKCGKTPTTARVLSSFTFSEIFLSVPTISELQFIFETSQKFIFHSIHRSRVPGWLLRTSWELRIRTISLDIPDQKLPSYFNHVCGHPYLTQIGSIASETIFCRKTISLSDSWTSISG